jgi:hypothetical protein
MIHELIPNTVRDQDVRKCIGRQGLSNCLPVCIFDQGTDEGRRTLKESFAAAVAAAETMVY